MTESILIADIKIPQGREPRANVRVLADSIEKIGLLNPITVRVVQVFAAGAEPTDGFCLVAGRNRMEAMKLLGHTKIPATVISLEDLEYRLVEFDENLIRSDIPIIDQGARLEEHKQIYESLYPETGWGKSLVNNTEPKDRKLRSFAVDAAAKIGLSKATIERLIKVGKLPDGIKDLVRNTPLADNQHELLKLSRIKYEQDQRDAVKAHLSGETATITGAKKRGPTKTERQQAADNVGKILVKYVPPELWPQFCTDLKLNKATTILTAFRKLQKAKSR